jgi:drug/metabolite transporter (DMT)-like permease
MSSRFSVVGAIPLAIAGFTLWVLADSTIKLVSNSHLPVFEVTAFMGLFIVACLVAWSWLRGELPLLRPTRPSHLLLRSLLDLGNNLGVIVALRHVPLTLFYILVFSAPMVITILAALFLGEHIRPMKALAVLAGFAGVVIAVNPFGSARHADWIGYAACLFCVACFSANMIWLRVLTRTETPQSLALSAGVVMAVAGFAAMTVHAEPLTPRLLATLFAIGAFCAAGSVCYYFAVKHTSASNVSQYHYTQLLTGALVSYLVWRELPTRWMVLGGTLIVISGLYIAWHATRQEPLQASH